MPPAPPEVYSTATSQESHSEPFPVSQHGSTAANEQASGGFSEVPRVPTPDDVDDASVTSSNYRGRRFEAGRISSNGSSAESSPGSRIDAYERAHGIRRRPSNGVVFQIIPTAKDKQNAVSIEHFPNEVLTHIISHLPPENLSRMSLVSRRFHKLVTTPPAWRIAFTRYFPGTESAYTNVQSPSVDSLRTERRYFTRLSALASWRSEYILRTRLLRSLARGRPAITSAAKSSSRNGAAPLAAVVTYGSGLLYPVSNIHATFGTGLNKKQPLFMHGASEQGAVSVSDPTVNKIGGWGPGDFENFKHFEDSFIGETEYGLGPGNIVGMPNVMDVSQPYGKIYGEACPGGRLFFTSTTEQRGRFLPIQSSADRENGIPEVTMIGCAITSVWIAKSEAILKATNGIIGCMAGFSNGVLAAYALGVNPVQDRKFAHGEVTVKWACSPGVPIVAIIVDGNINARRITDRKVWIAVLNALGEVFYLTDIPIRPDFKGRATSNDLDRLAWQTGRSVQWFLIESTRRSAVVDPFDMSVVDGSYSPRSSCDVQGLSKEQLVAETREIEKFLMYKPKHFRNVCEGWDMRRRLLVDFEGNDRRGGELFFVIDPGLDEGSDAVIKRISRCKVKTTLNCALDEYPLIASTTPHKSIFSDAHTSHLPSPSIPSASRSRTSSNDSVGQSSFTTNWHISNFGFGYLRGLQISAVASDESDFAVLTVNEDPLLGMSTNSNASSPLESPIGRITSAMPTEIPGQRARFMAVGTTTGNVLLWNMRAGVSSAPDIINTIQPSRIIHTRSPQISSLAMTSLYLVHGGNDGLVQAWDPLASDADPIRTLNSRFSDRARRRIAQAEASIHGVGKNYYAAGAIVLDPDPTVLRGMVSLGTHLRYWSYSASAADAYKSRKRGQLRRRSERGSNSAANEQKFHHTGRSVLKDYIQTAKQDLEIEKAARRKKTERLTGRFGTNLLGEDASEEEILAYATMLSEEAFAKDEKRLRSSENSVVTSPSPSANEMMDADMEEAIRLSLLDSEFAMESPQTNEFDIQIKQSKNMKRGTSSQKYTSSSIWPEATPEEDLDFALRLSLAEQESRLVDNNQFPALSASPDRSQSLKGKAKSQRG